MSHPGVEHRAEPVARSHRVRGEVVATVDSLRITFQGQGEPVQALRGVSLQIVRGETIGLVGESGSGKSVLGLSLLGLLPRNVERLVEGSVTVEGVDMLSDAGRSLRSVRRLHLGAIFQDPMTSLNPTMRVGQQVEEAAGSQGEALRLLDAVGIPDAARRYDAYPHELSGGLRQRVMAAIAVASDPALIIADEPTTALDVTVQAQLLELLRHLGEQFHCAILFITHDLGVAGQVADRIAVLYGGVLAEIGPTQALLRDPRHPYTKGLLASRIDLETDRTRPLRPLPGDPPDPRRPLHGCPFKPRCAFARDECANSVPSLLPAGDALVACLRREEALEDEQARLVPGWPERTLAVSEALRVSDARCTFGRRRSRGRLHALRGVSLSVAVGECLAIVGESGSGKSTLLRAVAGLVKLDSGELELAGERRPQMVFQDAGASLTPWLTLGELIAEPLRGNRIGRAERAIRVAEALARVGLPAAAARARPRELSGGQRQRAAIARAIVADPSILLCDEPTSALDVSLAATVLNLLGHLRRELKMTMIFVTHDLAAARQIADRVAVMYLGRIVELGPVETVTASPAHPYTQALLRSVPRLDADPDVLLGEPPSAYAPPSGCAFRTRCPVARESCAERSPSFVAVRDDGAHEVDCVQYEGTV